MSRIIAPRDATPNAPASQPTPPAGATDEGKDLWKNIKGAEDWLKFEAIAKSTADGAETLWPFVEKLLKKYKAQEEALILACEAQESLGNQLHEERDGRQKDWVAFQKEREAYQSSREKVTGFLKKINDQRLLYETQIKSFLAKE